MSRESGDCCRSCKFYVPTTGPGTPGTCHHGPPGPVVIVGGYQQAQQLQVPNMQQPLVLQAVGIQIIGLFPPTQENEYCFKFQPMPLPMVGAGDKPYTPME